MNITIDVINMTITINMNITITINDEYEHYY